MENKTGAYFKYAIGEIVLVVIGILIALSINNWNEKRKDRSIEKQILDEMLVSLKSDKSIFEMLEKRLIDKDSAIQKYLDFREQGELPEGYTIGGLIGKARQTIRLSYDLSPYENLVSLGINKMSDKKLVKAINKYYAQDLPRGVAFLEVIDQVHRPKTRKYEEEAIERGVLKKYFVKPTKGDSWRVTYQSNPNQLLKDEKIYLSMVEEFQYMSSSLGRLRSLMKYNNTIIKLLENN